MHYKFKRLGCVLVPSPFTLNIRQVCFGFGGYPEILLVRHTSHQS